MNACRIIRLGGKRRCCPATQTPKVRVLLLHYVLHTRAFYRLAQVFLLFVGVAFGWKSI